LAEELKQARRQHLMAEQQQIAFEWGRRQVGRTHDVLIDAPVEQEEDVWIGRTFADAPAVDGLVYVSGGNHSPGQIVPCEIVTSQGYDLIAAAAGEPR
jgi:ribosomal protein S12 methylthiotransferase